MIREREGRGGGGGGGGSFDFCCSAQTIWYLLPPIVSFLLIFIFLFIPLAAAAGDFI